MNAFKRTLSIMALWLITAAVHAGTVTYVYTDPQGTPLAEADATGTITARFDYAPYGAASTASGMSGAPNGPGYTGHVNDPESGFVYMQARYQDPLVGRFLSVDPLEPSAGGVYSFNRYDYASNNPIAHTDPSGKASVSTMIDNAAEGCSALTCAGWASLKAVYEVGSLGFSSVHDPMRDAYDNGQATGEEYVKIGIAGGLAVALTGTVVGDVGGKAIGSAIGKVAGGFAARGLGGVGSFSSTTNAAGGEVFTSVGSIFQKDFKGIVNTGLFKGDVNILTGVHGTPSGEMIPEASFYNEDMATFGNIPGVNVYNLPSMTPGEISGVLNGPGTTIGGFCNSGACLAPLTK